MNKIHYSCSTSFGNYDIFLKASYYLANPKYLSILAYDYEDGSPFEKLTVFIENDITPQPGYAFLNINNDWVEKFVKTYKLAKPVFSDNNNQIILPSGFLNYPLYQFDLNQLKQSNEENILQYLKNFN